MSSSNNDTSENTDVDNNSHIRQTISPPTISNVCTNYYSCLPLLSTIIQPSESSSPSCPTLLVIDDNSNSDDSIKHTTNNIPIKPMHSTIAQIPHIQIPSTISPSTHDNIIMNDTVEQQRRRNSSIAKLLGGHPLHNQQYEEINQQILDAQSAHNITYNNENGIDSGIQRSRSSITRTLLMNPERTNSMTKLPPKPQTASAPSFAKDFEYLIRQEVDTEHALSTIQRNNSAPKISTNLNSPSNATAQSSPQWQLKRKRPVSKPRLTVPNKSATNAPPFSLHEPFELESSVANPVPSTHNPQQEFHRYDPSKRSRQTNQQPYNLPGNNSTANQSSSYHYHNLSINSAPYNRFNVHQDRMPSNNCSASCNCSHYSHSTKLTLPSPATHLPSTTTVPHDSNNTVTTPMRKTKSLFVRPDVYEYSRQRSYSSTSNQSDASLAASSEPNVPLKKRLLLTYNNEQPPSSSL